MITKERLQELFDYVEGRLVKRATGRGPCVGSGGRLNVVADGKNEYHSRAVWVWHYGELKPGQVVKHVSADKFDESIENLHLWEPTAGDGEKPMRERIFPGVYRVGDVYSVKYKGRNLGDDFQTALEAVLARNEFIAKHEGLHKLPKEPWGEEHRAEFLELRYVLGERGARDPSRGREPWSLGVPPTLALQDMRRAVDLAELRAAKTARENAAQPEPSESEPPAEPVEETLPKVELSDADKFMADLMAEAKAKLGDEEVK